VEGWRERGEVAGRTVVGSRVVAEGRRVE